MDVNDIKEKIIVIGITALVFLPIRLLVSQYLAEHWLGNLGIATLISIMLIVLIKKDKLGTLGNIFKNQLVKSLWGRSAKIIVLTLVLFTCYFGTTILLIDRGNTLYYDDKEVLFQSISNNEIESLRLSGPQIKDNIFGLPQIQYADYLFSISYAMLNDAMGGMLINLHLILFVEQVELLGLFWFYRKIFRPKQPITA